MPEPPSSIHQAAHIAGHPLPGPSQHPDSWHTLQPISLTGLVFGTKSVQVGLTVRFSSSLRLEVNMFEMANSYHSPNRQALF